MPTVGVIAAIFDEDRRILCAKHEYGRRLWHLPGGRMESGESVHDTLKRETREETGYLVEPIRLIGVYSHPAQNNVVIFFEATIVGREPWEPNDEISQTGFFMEDALPETVHPWASKKISDAFSSESGFVQCWSRVADAWQLAWVRDAFEAVSYVVPVMTDAE